LPNNAAPQASVIGPDGTLYTVPKSLASTTTPFSVFANSGAGWTVVATEPQQDKFLPTGADFCLDAKLYILFRTFGPTDGFATRVQRFSVSGQRFGPGQTQIEPPFVLHGNLEGLSIWRDALGRLTATMISDDNGNFFQRSSLV
jgi:hypothetical protein